MRDFLPWNGGIEFEKYLIVFRSSRPDAFLELLQNSQEKPVTEPLF